MILGLKLPYINDLVPELDTFTKRNIKIDYAFVPYSNDLGSTHLFNFTFSI